MRQTSKKDTKFNSDLVKQYMHENKLTYENFAAKLGDENENLLSVNASTLRGYISGNIQEVPIEVLIAMANTIGVTLDYLCYNTNNNAYEKAMLEKWGLTEKTAKLLEEYRPYKTLISSEIKPKDFSKKDYNEILNLFLEKKIKVGKGKKSLIEIFNRDVLNLLICSTLSDDKNFTITFKESFEKLALDINKLKQQPIIGDNKLKFSFEEILNSKYIKQLIKQTKNSLHDAIDELLEISLREEFDKARVIRTLF